MLEISHLTLRRGKSLLLEDTNLSIHRGERVGIIGTNGVGKSSLFALILNQLEPDAGNITLPVNLTIAHVAQETPALQQSAINFVLDGDQELRALQDKIADLENPSLNSKPLDTSLSKDNTPPASETETPLAEQDALQLAELHTRMEAISGYSAKSRAAQLLSGLGFAPQAIEQSVETFSGGWRMRLNLAQALMCRSDLLLLDEPTNHLDIEAILWLEAWLLRYQGTLLLISHDREFLDHITTHIAHLYQQKVTLYTGNYSHFETQKAAKFAQQQQAYLKQQHEIAHMQSFIDRFRAKATKAKQAQSRIKALERMQKISAAHVDSPFHIEFKPVGDLPATLLTIDGLSVQFPSQATPILKAVNINIGHSARIGLLGRNGAGKSTLIKALATPEATDKHISGNRSQAKILKIGYYAQHQLEQLDVNASALTHLIRLDPKASEQALRDFLGRFAFHGERATTAIQPMSGGEKARLALALIIYQGPNLLLLDEPTNHLDLEMRFALTSALQSFAGALVVISHDRHLLENCCENFWFVANQAVTEFDGTLEDYHQWLNSHTEPDSRPLENADPQNPNTPYSTQLNTTDRHSKKEQRQKAAEQRRQREPMKRKLKKIEQDIEHLQKQYADLQSQLADPDLYEHDNKETLKALIQQESKAKRDLDLQEEIWLDLSEQIDHQEPE